LAMGVVVMLVVVMGWGSGKVEGTSFPFEIPEIVIDLDASPEARWEAAVERVLAKHGFDDSFGSIVAFWDETLPSVLGDVVQDVASSLESYIPQEYAAEMRGLHGALVKAGFGDKMPFSRLVALNLLYELTTACTSIVTQDGEGKMWHARNLDWTFGSHSMANLTVSASFQSQGKTEYKAITWVGYVGVLTGASDVFSVTIDQRTSHTVAEIVENLHRMKADHAQSVVLTARTALSESKTYLEAITTLSSTPLSAEVYYIVGGHETGQGCVLTRSYTGLDYGLYCIPDGPQPWFVLETNYDVAGGIPAPAKDDRRKVATAAMEGLGGPSGVNATSLFGVLQSPGTPFHTRGVLNSLTQYSIVMSASTGFFQAWCWQ